VITIVLARAICFEPGTASNPSIDSGPQRLSRGEQLHRSHPVDAYGGANATDANSVRDSPVHSPRTMTISEPNGLGGS
jgi:hypothetical protein